MSISGKRRFVVEWCEPQHTRLFTIPFPGEVDVLKSKLNRFDTEYESNSWLMLCLENAMQLID